MKQEYFSDDELEMFLEDVEQNEMHMAPFYLKREIMEQAFPEQKLRNVVDKKKTMSRAQRQKWIMYNCKVVLAAAAAIVVLFLLPTGENGSLWGEEDGNMSQVTNSIGSKSEQLCDVLSTISDKLIINDSNFQNKESEE